MFRAYIYCQIWNLEQNMSMTFYVIIKLQLKIKCPFKSKAKINRVIIALYIFLFNKVKSRKMAYRYWYTQTLS